MGDTSAVKTTGQGSDVLPNSTWAGCCPNYSILDSSGNDRYKRAQHEIPCPSVKHIFLLPQYHEDMEPVATAGCISAQHRGLQAAAPDVHHVNTTPFLTCKLVVFFYPALQFLLGHHKHSGSKIPGYPRDEF